MIKTYTFLSARLADKPITVKDGTASVSTGTTSTTINVEATDEVPAPFYVGTLETEDGDIDCSGKAA